MSLHDEYKFANENGFRWEIEYSKEAELLLKKNGLRLWLLMNPDENRLVNYIYRKDKFVLGEKCLSTI